MHASRNNLFLCHVIVGSKKDVSERRNVTWLGKVRDTRAHSLPIELDLVAARVREKSSSSFCMSTV